MPPQGQKPSLDDIIKQYGGVVDTPQQAQPSPSLDDIIKQHGGVIETPRKTGFAAVAGPKVNPLNIIKGLYSEFVERPLAGIEGAVNATNPMARNLHALRGIPMVGSELERIASVWAGDKGTTADKAIESIPLIGGTINRTAERIDSGDYGGAAGELVDIPMMIYGPKVAGKGAQVAGRGMQMAGRGATRIAMRPFINDAAREMTGIVDPLTHRIDVPAANAAINAEVVASNLQPGLFMPSRNRAGAAIDASERAVASHAQAGAGTTPVNPQAVRLSQPVTQTASEAQRITGGDQVGSVRAIETHLTPLRNQAPMSAATIMDNTAGSRRLSVGRGATGPASFEPRMARSIQQGNRDAAARAVRTETHPNSPAMAAEIERQARLAPVEEALSNIKPLLTMEGSLKAKMAAALASRIAAPTARNAMHVGRATERLGGALGGSTLTSNLAMLPREELIRMAILAELQQSMQRSGGR